MSKMPRPSRRAVLKTSGAAALLGAVPFPAQANSAPQRAHHAATPVVLQFDVLPPETGPADGPGVVVPPLTRVPSR